MCEQTGADPDPDEMPPTTEDYPFEVQVAFLLHDLLPDRWEGMSGSYMGKDFSSIGTLLDIWEVKDKKTCLYFIKHIEARNTEKINKSQERKRKAQENKAKNIKILGVSSALTSKASTPTTSDEVLKDFLIAKESQIDGVICPPSEIVSTKKLFNLIVTPGIRLENDDIDDQKNTTTPELAIQSGADYLVMGRSLRNNIEYVIKELKL